MSKRHYKVEIVHYVDESKGIVVAVAKHCSTIALEEIASHPMVGSIPYQRYVIQDTYRAVARCAGGDTFDVDTGIKIADKKLHAKLDRIMAKKLLQFSSDQCKVADDFSKLSEKYLTLYKNFANDQNTESDQ